MILDRFRLDDRVALVTGAGRGIGRGCALAFAEAGADVVVAARTADQIEDTAEEIRKRGRRALAVPCDVSDAEARKALVARAQEHFSRVDVLVNNAGGSPPSPALQTSESMFNQAFQFNVTQAFEMTKLVAPGMLAQGRGAVVNISSAAGRLVQPNFAAYGTAKAALSTLSKLLGNELAPKIRVNAIAVGTIQTSALMPYLDDTLRGQMEALTPMRSLGEVEDIAACALYLASPAAGWVTGKVFEIDGGTEATTWPFPHEPL